MVPSVALHRYAMKKYDLIVLGGGRASALAVAASAAGKQVALIEKNKLGGTCPNSGCVPSKLLIGFAEVARKVKEASAHYIDAQIKSMDVTRMIRETNQWSSEVDARYQSRHPDTLEFYRGHGAFVSDHVVEVNGEHLMADEIVIATGTRPRKGPFSDLPIWTSDDLFPLKGDVPKSITIVGGGFIAVELANFLDAVGVQTTVMVIDDRLLPAEDNDISTLFAQQFCQHVDTRFNTAIESASHDGKQFTLQLDNGQTHATRYQLQHIASFEAKYLEQRILKENTAPIDYGAIPHAVFSHPEVAAVGTRNTGLSFDRARVINNDSSGHDVDAFEKRRTRNGKYDSCASGASRSADGSCTSCNRCH